MLPKDQVDNEQYEIEREREGSPQNSIEGDRERGATRVLGGFWERKRDRDCAKVMKARGGNERN